MKYSRELWISWSLILILIMVWTSVGAAEKQANYPLSRTTEALKILSRKMKRDKKMLKVEIEKDVVKPRPNTLKDILSRRGNPIEHERRFFKGVLPIPPKRAKVERRIFFPENVQFHRNILDPAPIPNNLQLYPFTLHIPMEGSSLLAYKEMEFFATQTYSKGDMNDASANFDLKVSQWYFEQTFAFRFGLPHDMDIQISIPLYHFRGQNSFMQNGVEMIGLGRDTRNFWGGPALRIKKQVYENNEHKWRGLFSVWFQFPEGNQRARGGTSSGHWALNGIVEKAWDDMRLNINIGIQEAGELKLFNDVRLPQKQEYFTGISLSKAITSVLAIEGQFHAYRSALAYTDLPDFRKWRNYASLGVRGHNRRIDWSLSTLAGTDDFPELSVVTDIRFRW